MAKIERNSPCPCGSGKKYKYCCEKKETEMRRQELPSSSFGYESGSYGGPGRGYMPSILCYKQHGPDSWTEHFCLVKSDVVLEKEYAAVGIAEKHLESAHKVLADGRSPQDFARTLRDEGYKNVSDFRVVRSGDNGEV